MYRYGFLPDTDFTRFGPFIPYASRSLYFLFSLRTFSPVLFFPVLLFSCASLSLHSLSSAFFPRAQTKKRPVPVLLRPGHFLCGLKKNATRPRAPPVLPGAANIAAVVRTVKMDFLDGTRFFPALPFLHTPLSRASFPLRFPPVPKQKNAPCRFYSSRGIFYAVLKRNVTRPQAPPVLPGAANIAAVVRTVKIWVLPATRPSSPTRFFRCAPLSPYSSSPHFFFPAAFLSLCLSPAFFPRSKTKKRPVPVLLRPGHFLCGFKKECHLPASTARVTGCGQYRGGSAHRQNGFSRRPHTLFAALRLRWGPGP